jgi:hypothetical protein
VTTPLRATVEPPAAGGEPDELAVTLRITNASDAAVAVLNPDVGRPSPQMRWPWSVEAYRAALLMSYGYLAVSVTGAAGEPVDRQPVETWATPVLRPRVALAPGDALEVPIPVGRFFPLAPGGTYRLSVDYGDDALKVHADGAVDVPGDDASGGPAG